MSEFFQPPPEPPREREPRRRRQPPWLSAPSGTLAGIVPIELVLARTDRVAVCVGRLAAYPEGFTLEVRTMGVDNSEDLDPLLFGPVRRRGRRELPDEMLRFGLEFADGARATNTSGSFRRSDEPEGPVLMEQGGGGGGGDWQQEFWVWPLPPPGPLAFVCEWPAQGIALTRAEVDARAVLDAAARAQVIFSDEDLPEWPDDEDGDEREDVDVNRPARGPRRPPPT